MAPAASSQAGQVRDPIRPDAPRRAATAPSTARAERAHHLAGDRCSEAPSPEAATPAALFPIVAFGIAALLFRVAAHKRAVRRPVRHVGPVVSLKFSGDIAILLPTLREEGVFERIHELEARIEDLVASGNRRLVVDLSDTKGCADDIAGTLMRAVCLYEEHGGKAVMCGVSTDLRHFFHMGELGMIFEMYDTEAEAIASLGGL